MSFNWSEYLSLAQELTSSSGTSPIQEAHLRAAISRAYYAAFCKARNHLIDKQGYIIPGGVNVHRLVVNEFKNSSDVTRKTVGNLLVTYPLLRVEKGGEKARLKTCQVVK